jgi:Fe-S cluster biogenesis protein NfuA
MAKVESLIEKAERFSDPAAREVTREIVAALLELHGAGLARVLELLAADQSAQRVVSSFASDGLVASLLLLHGLHPVDLESRVRMALDAVRPMLKSHGGGVELLGVEDGIVRIRLEGNCDGCPSSSETLRNAVTTALDEAAPDRIGLEVSGLEPPVVPSRTFSLPMLGEVVVGAR